MLVEQFAASIAAPTKPNTGVTKDAGIFFHEYQPLAAQRHVFKKSATAPHGLAVSSSHVFAAQAGKALVHVYNRDKGNQEAIVPFPERIHSIALAAGDMVLLLGTESGRILAWELSSGRLLSTSTSHLEPVSTIAVDQTSNLFLTGSKDAMIHVWSLHAILSFAPDTSRSPLHTMSSHRGPIVSLACGHSPRAANIAISLSQDKSAIIWDYQNGQALRTYLLPDIPTAVSLDPADRAFYVGYEDGSLQTVLFFDDPQKSTPVDLLHDVTRSHQLDQPPSGTRFDAESQNLGSVLSLSLSWDGTTLLSGHGSGKVSAWDIAKGNFISTLATLPGPVTNLQFLTPKGFARSAEAKLKIHAVVKPKQDTAGNETGLVPPSYSLTAQLMGQISASNLSQTERNKLQVTDFEEAVSHSSFPLCLLEEGLVELEAWDTPTNGATAPAADFFSFPTAGGAVEGSTAEDNAVRSIEKTAELQELKQKVAALQRIQKVTFSQLSSLREENAFLLSKERERARKRQAHLKGQAPQANGDGDVEMRETLEPAVGSESESNDSDGADEDSQDQSESE